MNLRALERWTWYAFVATFAWQTRLILWHADRAFIEWRSISLYASDVFMLALFVFAIVGGWRVKGIRRFTFLFFLFAALSLFNAEQVTVGVYALVRLAQGIAFFCYMRGWAWRRFDADHTALAFVIGALVQAGIGIGQYASQHDLGLRWLGETLLRTDMRGVAVFFDAAHAKVLRAYGTLPHPNVLAAYLGVALGVVGWLWLRHGMIRHRWVMPSTVVVLLWAFYLTFSRTIIAVWVAAALTLFVAMHWKRISAHWPNILILRRRMTQIALTVAVVSIAFASVFWPQLSARLTIHSSDEAVQLRVAYVHDSLDSGEKGFLGINWFGVGIGNFTTWLARTQPSLPAAYVQPAHNVFLLIYSEIGIFGVLAFIAWLGTVFWSCGRSHRHQPVLRIALLVLLGSFCCIALFDHFFWTLQQGRILFWGIAALAAGALPGTIQSHGRQD